MIVIFLPRNDSRKFPSEIIPSLPCFQSTEKPRNFRGEIIPRFLPFLII